MNRGRILAASMLITFSAVFVQAVALPSVVRACSCADFRSMAEVVAEGDATIVAGVVGRQLPDRTPVAVDTWFHGSGPSDMVWVSGGSQMMTSCDPFMEVGERRVFVLHGRPGELYSVDPCSVGGVIGTENGDAALAEAQALFGTGNVPPTLEPTDPPEGPPAASPLTGEGMLWLAVAVAAAAVMFGGIALLALRRQPR
jgi:hypothetical protein